MVCKFVFLRFLSISFSNKSYFDGSVYESTDCQNLINKTFVGPHKLDIEHWRRGWFAWMPGCLGPRLSGLVKLFYSCSYLGSHGLDKIQIEDFFRALI